jgi:hypothetical protein
LVILLAALKEEDGDNKSLSGSLYVLFVDMASALEEGGAALAAVVLSEEEDDESLLLSTTANDFFLLFITRISGISTR